MAALNDMDGRPAYKGIYLGALSALVRLFARFDPLGRAKCNVCTTAPHTEPACALNVARQKNDYSHGQGKTSLHVVKALAVLIDRLRRADEQEAGAAAQADADTQADADDRVRGPLEGLFCHTGVVIDADLLERAVEAIEAATSTSLSRAFATAAFVSLFGAAVNAEVCWPVVLVILLCSLRCLGGRRTECFFLPCAASCYTCSATNQLSRFDLL